MADIKTFTIKINGLEASIDAVKSLNNQLEALEKRINALQGKVVNVSTSVSSGGGNRTGALSEEEKIERQIEQIQEQQAAHQTEQYKALLLEKETLKEINKEQKASTAEIRLQENAYENTMQGMKQHLADIKAAMQTVDLGDTDAFKKLTNDANELNNKLKEIEQSYGVFSRSVGNYASAAEGFKGLKIQVGDTVREFSSAREALRTLSEELKNLSINGEANTEQADQLREAYNNLKSAIDDATISSKVMDEAMDIMTSFASIASIGQGLQSFFGLDNNEITKSIQNLVSLQSVLQGIEALRKQMDTNEGLGGVFKKGSAEVDKFVAKITGAKIGMNGLEAATKGGTLAVKAFSTALKGIGIGAAMVAVSMAVEGVQKLIGLFGDWVKGDADLVDSIDVTNARIDEQNTQLEKNIALIDARRNAGQLSAAEAMAQKEQEYANAVKESAKALQDRLPLLKKENLWSTGATINLENSIGDKGVTTLGGYNQGIKNIEDFKKRYEELETAVKNGTAAVRDNEAALDGLLFTASDNRDELAHMNKLIGQDFMNAMTLFADGTAEGAKSLAAYIAKMDKVTDGAYSRGLKAIKVDNESLQAELDNALKMVDNFRNYVESNPAKVSIELDSKIKQKLAQLFPKEEAQRQIDEWQKILTTGVDDAGNAITDEQRKNIERILKAEKEGLNKSKSANTSYSKKLLEAKKDLNNLIIQNMKEGLNKTLRQLEEERKAKLAKVEHDGILVGKREVEINKLYDKKIEEAKKEHAENVKQIYDRIWKEILDLSATNNKMLYQQTVNSADKQREAIERRRAELMRNVYSYGIQGKNTFSLETANDLGIVSRGIYQPFETDDEGYKKLNETAKQFTEQVNKLVDLERQVAYLENRIKAEAYRGVDTTDLKKQLIAAQNEYQTYYDALKKEYHHAEIEGQKQLLYQESYSKQLIDIAHQRYAAMDSYWEQRLKVEREQAKKEYDAKYQVELDAHSKSVKEFGKFRDEQEKIIKNSIKKGLLTEKEGKATLNKIKKEYDNNDLLLAQQWKDKKLELEKERTSKERAVESEKLQDILQYYRDYYTALNALEERQPVTNEWGVVNIKQTKANYRELIAAYKEMAKSLQAERKYINGSEILSDQEKEEAIRELDTFESDLGERLDNAKNNLTNTFGKFIQDIQQYIQVLGQSIQTALSSIDEYADYQLDKEQDALEKQNELLEEKLSEQEDIIQKHSDKVNDIEDELSTARGDRRQYLIDQLNSEIAAQRAAEAERQRIEREQAALEKKQEALDKKREIQDYNRKLRDILVSGALAVSNAFATSPFVPVGLAMGALATSLTAFQYAMAKKAKPFKDGGIISGPRHKDGGVKVLGGHAEVEGGEFITNRVSTAKNVQLLEYINSKKKTVDLSDMIDFYSEKPRTTIKKIRSKFADGGTLPTNIDISESLDRNIIIRDDSVYQVSVVDINRQQENLKNVQVLAGLN